MPKILRDTQKDCGKPGCRNDYRIQVLARGDPDEAVPGNNMKPYSGLASSDDRKKVMAFLRSVTTARP